ncbi:alpha/beta fold hydrolase [Rhizobiales bacterium 3FA27D7]|uniref:alpha/beta hydrolase n=1 Tax=Mesorhizobium sp. 2RAF21 TaxID=3232995 RepID=UPI0010F46F40
MISGDVFMLAGGAGEPRLLVRRLVSAGPAVLYVHGATFPSALSVVYRFEGHSWMDDLHRRGFDVWAFDFAGYGGSGRPVSFSRSPVGRPPGGRAPAACRQLARVVAHVLAATGGSRVSLIAHSWGSLVAGRYAAARPETVDRLALFGPIARRAATGHTVADFPGWRVVSVADQLSRFVEDVPAGHPPVLIEPQLASWGPAYLATDPRSGSRTPPAVQIPSGPVADIAAAWAGRLPYDPSRIEAPTLIVRGQWDSVSNDADAAWLMGRLGSRIKLDRKLPKGTHLMHLETGRTALFETVGRFLTGETNP